MILLSGLSCPRDEFPLFRQKCPKPFSPVRLPPENGETVRQQGRRRCEGRGVQARTLRPSNNENAAGGLFHHSLPGELRPGTEYMARKLAESILSLVEGLKHPSPNSRIRYRRSAPPDGGEKSWMREFCFNRIGCI